MSEEDTHRVTLPGRVLSLSGPKTRPLSASAYDLSSAVVPSSPPRTRTSGTESGDVTTKSRLSSPDCDSHRVKL